MRPRAVVGVAGTVTTLATLHLGLDAEEPERLHGHRIPRAWIERKLAGLSAVKARALAGHRGIHPDRAPVLVAGIAVVAETLAHFGLRELEVSERDILHGGALEAAALPPVEEGAAPPGAFTCC